LRLHDHSTGAPARLTLAALSSWMHRVNWTWTSIVYFVLVMAMCCGFVRTVYRYLGRFAGWQSPVKRLLAISPVLLAMLFALSGFLLVAFR